MYIYIYMYIKPQAGGMVLRLRLWLGDMRQSSQD